MALKNAASPRPSSDIVEILGPQGILVLLELIVDAYTQLKGRNAVAPTSSENEITEELFIHVTELWRQKQPPLPVVPVHQKEDKAKAKSRGRAPTIDFCFRATMIPESYFGAECKLLDQGSSQYIKEYVGTDGMLRFIDCRYAMKSSMGAMVGYVRIGDPKRVALQLDNEIAGLHNTPKLRKLNVINSFDDIYETSHVRTCGVSPLGLFHLFLSFTP